MALVHRGYQHQEVLPAALHQEVQFQSTPVDRRPYAAADLPSVSEGLRKLSFIPEPVCFSPDQLKEFTNYFDEANLIGPTQFGKVYRGKMFDSQDHRTVRHVTIKMWCDDTLFGDTWGCPDERFDMLDREVKLLTHPSLKSHPNIVKLIGFCREQELIAVVYDLNPLDNLHNHIVKDEFTWIQRVKVALCFARVLEFLHFDAGPYLVFNIDAAHIMLDQDCNPLLFDFGLMTGGILGRIGRMNKLKSRILMSFGYIDRCFLHTGLRCRGNDVYAYGVLLMSLIAKKVVQWSKYTVTIVDAWAKKVCKPNSALVYPGVEDDPHYSPEDGLKLTELSFQCFSEDMGKRPIIDEVVKRLEKLEISRCI